MSISLTRNFNPSRATTIPELAFQVGGLFSELEDFLDSRIDMFLVGSKGPESKKPIPSLKKGDILFDFSKSLGFATLQQWNGEKLVGFDLGSFSGFVNLITQGTGSGTDATKFLKSNGTQGWELADPSAFVLQPPFLDTNPLIKGSSDATKLFRFEIDAITSATTRTVTVLNQDGTMVLAEANNIFSSTLGQIIDTGSNGATYVTGLRLRNDTASTVGTTLENAPPLTMEAHGWDGIDRKLELQQRFYSLNNAGRAKLSWAFALGGGAYTEVAFLRETGGFTVLSSVTAGSAGFSTIDSASFNSGGITLNNAFASIQNLTNTNPLLFNSSNTTASCFNFRNFTSLTSGHLITGMVPSTGFTGSYLKFGTTADGSTFATTVFEVTSTGNLTATKFNGLTLTANAIGFSIAGGTTSKTFSITGNATINNDFSTTGIFSTNGEFSTSGKVSFIGAGGDFLLRITASTDVTFPTTGTLATLDGVEILTNKTLNNLVGGQTFSLTGTITVTSAIDINDYNPGSTSVIRVNPTADITITGIAGGTPGKIYVIHNAGTTTNYLYLTSLDAGSAPANQFAASVSQIVIQQDEMVFIQYDGIILKWRVLYARAPKWGEIIGLLSNQGDLQGALDFKLTIDANNNAFINNLARGYTSTAMAGGTTTLTSASTYIQNFTGSSTTAQTLKLPLVATLSIAHPFVAFNNTSGTGNLTVQSSGGNTIKILPPGTWAVFESNVASGTGAAVWNVRFTGVVVASGKKLTVSNSLTLVGTDGTTLTFPTTSATIARTDLAQTFTGNQTFSNIIIAGAQIRKKGYTVATLPAGTQGDTAFVTNALAPAFGAAVVGGGAVVIPVFYDGTNWIVG